MNESRKIALLLLMASPLLGQCAFSAEPTYCPKPGVVFVVGGVGGVDPLQHWVQVALPLAGVPHELLVFVWTHGKFRYLRDLQDTRYLKEQAGNLAAQVLAVKEEDPSRPVFLMGHSARRRLGAGSRRQSAARHTGPYHPALRRRVAVLRPAAGAQGHARRGRLLPLAARLFHAELRHQLFRHRGPLLCQRRRHGRL